MGKRRPPGTDLWARHQSANDNQKRPHFYTLQLAKGFCVTIFTHITILLATSWEELTHWNKTLMLGRIWGQEEKGTTEDEMAGWHHGLDERESE